MRLNLNVFKMADIQKLNVNSTTYDISTTWGKVTGKPDTFTPSSHTHDYLPLSGGTMTGNIAFGAGQIGVYSGSNGILAEVNSSNTWTGVSSYACTVVGSASTPTVIRTNSDNLYHYNGTDRYKIYTAANLSKSTLGLGNVQNTAFYARTASVNDTSWNLAGTTNSATTFTIYAPTTAGSNGQFLTSTGGTPSWTSISYYGANVSRTANTVLAAPNGSDGVASFRKLVAADLPSHTHNNYVTTDTAQTITGTKTFNNGDQSPITLVRSSSDFVSVRFDGSSGILGYLGFMGVDQPMYRRVSDNTYLNLLHSGNSSVSKSGETLTVTINGVSKSLTNTNTTYTSLKNPYSLSIFGVSYDGSSAKTLTGASFNEGTANLTDGTMLLTSYASDSGFADTNAPGTVYKRKASCVWGYIQGKADARYSLLGHTHNYAASSHTHTRSQITDFSHSHNYAGSSSAGGAANSVVVTQSTVDAERNIVAVYDPGSTNSLHYASGITMNYSKKSITATTFKGNLTGNVTGNCSGSSGSCTGNAATATAMSSFETASVADVNRYVWMSWSDNTGKPAYNSNLTFNTNSNTLKTVKVNASSGFYQSSDERLKTFYDPIKVDLDKLSKLRKNYFKFNDKDKLEIGVSAQEVQEIYPELVSSDDNGYLSVAYDKLSVIALSAIDKLDDDIKELKQENNDLKDQLSTIKNILKEKGIL